MDPRFESLARRIPAAVPRCADLSCVLGFDGTVDVICRAVRERGGPGAAFRPFPTIGEFGSHIVAADGLSAIIEIVVEQEKIGGNGPIMSDALAASGLRVDYIGPLGRPDPHPAYRGFAGRVCVHALASPAVTHALEFDNGKIMLTRLSEYDRVDAARLRDEIGLAALRDQVARSHLCGLLNWACLPGLPGILDFFLADVLPGLPPPDDGRARWFFFDLADPATRRRDDLRAMLERIAGFSPHGRAVLGMNRNETQWVCRALGLEPPGDGPDAFAGALGRIRESLGIHAAMGHPVDFAACATADGTWAVDGPYTPKPAITTGAGDHLNAGFCLGLLLDFPPPDALALGVLFSGFYVRNARTPMLAELPDFIARLAAGEGGTATP